MLVVTDRKARALRVKRGPFADNAAGQVFVVRGDRAVRVPIRSACPASTMWKCVSGGSEGDEMIISDMRDYVHLSEVTRYRPKTRLA